MTTPLEAGALAAADWFVGPEDAWDDVEWPSSFDQGVFDSLRSAVLSWRQDEK